jgi:hypothetical protein
MQFYLKGQIGHNLEVYDDDIIVNPEKCTFRVPPGKLLGYIITNYDIEATPTRSQPSLK